MSNCVLWNPCYLQAYSSITFKIFSDFFSYCSQVLYFIQLSVAAPDKTQGIFGVYYQEPKTMCSWGFGCSSFSSGSCDAKAQGLDWTLRIRNSFQHKNTLVIILPAHLHLPFSSHFGRKNCFPWKSVTEKLFQCWSKPEHLHLEVTVFPTRWFKMYIFPLLSLAWLDLPWCCWPSDSHDPLKKG